MSTAPALIAAAAGVGLGHAVLPDHWLPLAVVGRTQRYPLTRVARLSALAGVAHVLVSIVLGAIVIAIGLQFRSTVEHAEDTIVGCLLIATGVGFALLQATGHGHHHDHPVDNHGHEGHAHEHPGHHHHGHEHPHEDPQSRPARLAAIMVPFGAAASPDLTILPVFLAATAAGTGAAAGALVAFAAVTIGTIVTLTLLAARGGYGLKAAWLEEWGNVFTAVVLVVIGALVLLGVL